MAKMTKEQKDKLEEQRAKKIFRNLIIVMIALAVLSIVAFSFV